MAKFSLINSNGIQWLISKIKGHTENKNNPHRVTKAQVGLSNVSNLDQSKAISKVTTSEQGFTGTALNGSTTTWDMPKVIKDCSMESSSTSFQLLYTYTDTSEKTIFIKNGNDIYPGVTKLYSATGSNTDGAITQKAATNAIDDVNDKIIYTNDGSNNITFPKQVTATQFNGSLNGNAKTATSASTAKTANTATTANIATTANKVKNKLKINLRNPSSPKTSIEFDGSNEQVLNIPAYDDLNPLAAHIQIGDDLNNYITPGTYFFPYNDGAGTPLYNGGHSVPPGIDNPEGNPFILTVRRCPAQSNNWLIQTMYLQNFSMSFDTLQNAPIWKRYGKLDSNEDSATWEDWTCIIDSSILECMIIQESDITLDLTKAIKSTTYPGYPYMVSYKILGCTSDHYPQVQLANKTDGVYINDICKTGQGYIFFYVTKNTGTIKISSILLTCDFKHLFM